MLKPLVPGSIWFAQQPIKFGPFGIRTRMTVVRLADGGLWVYSPILPSQEIIDALSTIGEVRFVVAPNKSHHLFLLPFLRAFPHAKAYVAPGLAAKCPDLASLEVLSPERANPWEPDLTSHFVEGLSILNETAWFHATTGTLILTDLLFCFGADNPVFSRAVARVLGVYQHLGMSRTMKFMVNDKRALARTAEHLLSLPIQRIIVAHDSVIDVGAKDQVAQAFQRV